MRASSGATVTIEGEIIVRLERSDRRVRRVTIRSTRPYAASRVVLGRTPSDAAALVPSLFAICAHAQGAAAALAVEAAGGRSSTPRTLATRETAVWLETIQEYLWRLLVDWPQAQGRPVDVEPVAQARRLVAPLLARLAPLARRIDGDAIDERSGVPVTARVVQAGRARETAAVPADFVAALVALAARHVYGCLPADWLGLRGRDVVAAWAAGGPTLPARLLHELLARDPMPGRSDVALMPLPDRGALRAAVVPAMRSDLGYEREPTWAGAIVETGALARTHTHPIVAALLAAHGNAVPTRMVARLVELAQLLARIGATSAGISDAPRDEIAPDATCAHWVDAIELAPGEGLAAVQTARGLLLHRARIAGGRVAEYQIVAPTEWNFHPRGALVRGLEAAPADDEVALVRDARLVVQALDPCVACRVEVAGA